MRSDAVCQHSFLPSGALSHFACSERIGSPQRYVSSVVSQRSCLKGAVLVALCSLTNGWFVNVQLRSARPGSSSLGVLTRSLSQPGDNASGSPDRGPSAAGEASAATLVSEAASPQASSALPRLPSIRVRLSEHADPPPTDGQQAGSVVKAPESGSTHFPAEDGTSEASESPMADAQQSATGHDGDMRRCVPCSDHASASNDSPASFVC